MRIAIRASTRLRPPKPRTSARALRSPPRSKSAWGGARTGAGRPPRGVRSSEPHKQRAHLAVGEPVIVVARVVRAVGDLRRARAVGAVERAIDNTHVRADFRIVDVGVTGRRDRDDHGLELVVEADDRMALARGMQGFQVAAARALNALASRRGTVFADRYRVLKPRR